ncbi:hypothetical protein [Marivirga harenae]|uniref:hypothetical protein n=1 Tax=Marivirga harenae TaxID=2010992 RepID=UPI0026DFC7EB|nr:hypothetical protein [Marivirga harenae]WKV12340.1 hypothetical protein Q3Y49_00615 [Marivirga harenae]
MKLSNKILIGFFGLAFLYMIVAFTEMRFKGDLHRLTESNSNSESVEFSAINYLVLPDLQPRISVHGSDNPRIEIQSISGDLLKNLKYEMAGDTLSINSMEVNDNQQVNLSIYVSKQSFSGLKTVNAGLTISDLQQETLTIDQNDGWIRLFGSNKIGKINLKAQNSAYFNLVDGKLDTLTTELENSEVSISQPVKLVRGSMKDDSYLYLIGTEEIQFKKDESSRLILN